MNQDIQLAEQLDDCTTDAALFALGALPPGKAETVELRLRSGCPFCIAQVQHYTAIAEQLSLSVTPVQPSPGVKEKLLARVNAQDAASQPTGDRKVVRASDGAWMKLPFPGVEMRPLIANKTFMLRMQPGAAFPEHDHPQAEQCYVLAGSITDSDGLTLHAGDFVVMSRGTKHDLIRSNTGCTLFIAYAD